MAGKLFHDVEGSWTAAGRTGRPRMVAQVNVVVGSEATVQDAMKEVESYYRFTGGADWAIQNMYTTPQGVHDAITAFEDLGADEVMLYCWARDSDQVDRLADVVV
jgi:hypothetical protein